VLGLLAFLAGEVALFFTPGRAASLVFVSSAAGGILLKGLCLFQRFVHLWRVCGSAFIATRGGIFLPDVLFAWHWHLQI
jgi:hypothetical protein